MSATPQRVVPPEPTRAPIRIPRGLAVAIAVLLIAAGAAGFVIASADGAMARAWQAYLVNLLFFLAIAQGGVVVSASFYLTQARWGGPGAYRLAEAFAPFIVLGFVLFGGVFVGRAQIFPWVIHPIAKKAAWLNTPFLFARDGLGLAIMTGLSWWFLSGSRREDARRWVESPRNIEL